jgi:acylpyruvate hydrolase
MPFASYEHRSRPYLGFVDGNMVQALEGAAELGTATPADVLDSLPAAATDPVPVADVRLRPVVPRPDKVICVGLNYREHVGETGRELPEYPVLFTKFASALIGAHDDIVLPPESSQVDFEGELAVVIGRVGRRIPQNEAWCHVLGFTVANDVTMRDYQYKTHQWLQGKAWDSCTPLGPYLYTPAEIDVSALSLHTTLNGVEMQASDTSKLIFDIPCLVSTISEFTQLMPGDVILTGTPAGVGYRREPQVFLGVGDEVVVEIEGLGAVANRVVGQPLAQPS